MRTHLIIANQTLVGEALLGAVSKRIDAGPARFHVVVPATPPPHGITAMTWDEEETWRAASERLDAILAWLRARGAEADGEIGDRDPVAAARDALRRRPVDEIILSTLPPGTSRWLRQDVVSRLRAAVAVPVTVVTPARQPIEATAM
jgi:hypothetical protein